jgi:putative endonuclease
MDKNYYVYILSNYSLMFYIGFTSNLHKRIQEHKDKAVEGYTKKYNLNKLVYVEVFSNPNEGIEDISDRIIV